MSFIKCFFGGLLSINLYHWTSDPYLALYPVKKSRS